MMTAVSEAADAAKPRTTRSSPIPALTHASYRAPKESWRVPLQLSESGRSGVCSRCTSSSWPPSQRTVQLSDSRCSQRLCFSLPRKAKMP